MICVFAEKKDDSTDEDVTWLLANPQRDLLFYGNQPDADHGDLSGHVAGTSDAEDDDDASFERHSRAGGHQFLRFGRNMNHNFMRFGRGHGDGDHYYPSATTSLSSSSVPTTFFRLGRGANNNLAHQFMRIGRGDSRAHRFGPYDRNLDLDTALMSNYLPDVSTEMMSSEVDDEDVDLFDRPFRSINHSFLRFGRKVTGSNFARNGRASPSHNFMRFGRIPEHKFMRFGRSSDSSKNLSERVKDSSVVALEDKSLKSDIDFNGKTKKEGHMFLRFGRK